MNAQNAQYSLNQQEVSREVFLHYLFSCLFLVIMNKVAVKVLIIPLTRLEEQCCPILTHIYTVQVQNTPSLYYNINTSTSCPMMNSCPLWCSSPDECSFFRKPLLIL